MKLPQFALVLYKGQPAIISDRDMDKIEISLEKEKKRVREKDVHLLHTGPVKNICSVLSQPSQAYTITENSIQEIRDFFENQNPMLHELVELLWGTVPAENYWNIWNEISTSPYLAVTVPTEFLSIRTDEEIKALQVKQELKNNEESIRNDFVSRLKKSFAKKENFEIKGDDSKFLQEIEAVALGKTDKSKTLLLSNISCTAQNAHKILLLANFWSLDRNPFPIRHGHSLSSSSVIVEKPNNDTQRMDLTHLDSWAIDNEWSHDPDDAVSFDGTHLWVHIADPATTVLSDTPADLDARSRGATLYIPEGASRMLDDSALEYYALGLSDRSLALSFKLGLSETGSIDSVEIYQTIIKVKRLTYAQASEQKDSVQLKPLFELATRNYHRRISQGAVQIQLSEVHISVDAAKGNVPVVSIQPLINESASDMVREMMLLAGEGAARFAFKHGIPFQYVSQEEPAIPKDLPEGLAGEYRKRRSMKSRKVGTQPADHAGLGLGMYSQVTSPLRRYGDLVAHQQLHRYLKGEKLLETEEMLTRIAQGDSAARECTLAERETNLHWILFYLTQNPQWTGEAVVVDKQGSQTVILIPSLAQEARITLNKDLSLNTKITVRSGNINIVDQTVTFIPIE